MVSTQKIKKLIIILSVMSVLSFACIFHAVLNPFITKTLYNKFSFITSENNLIVHFIDVGQADAIAINLPDGKTMLIDDGTKDYNVSYVKYIKENVVQYKMNNKIDYLVLTHADSDHIGGTMKLLKNFKFNNIFMPKIMSNSQTFEEIYNYVNKYCEYQLLGDEFIIGNNEYKFTFFDLLNETNTNDSSQVIKLEYYNKSFLFAADISMEVEEDYISTYGNKLDCDVLKVAHHGSKTSTGEEFLDAVSPKYAVISVGRNNLYNHPHQETINKLLKNNIEILRTDKLGNIMFVVGRDYGLVALSGNYYITNLTFDYRTYVLVANVGLFGFALIVIIKKEKKKSKHR